MPSPFLSSEEYDERAHQLYNEGHYDEALDVLREGLALYPHAVELHVGVAYARLAREEYAWARRAFEEALVLDPEHEDAMAGLAETLLHFGQREQALKLMRRLLELGYQDDVELMLQVSRALFRDGTFDEAKDYAEIAVQQTPENSEAVALLGYVQHRLGDEDAAVATLRRALQLDSEHAEARIYLANVLYDRGDFEAALYHLDRTAPEEHWDELGIWRLMELKKTIYRLADADPELKPWDERLAELAETPDDIDEMLGEIEQRFNEDVTDGPHSQLELFGALLSDLVDQQRRDDPARAREPREPREPRDVREPREARGEHRVQVEDVTYDGSWADIVGKMRDASGVGAGRSIQDFMTQEARRLYRHAGVRIPADDPESFIRGSADAGLLRIVR